MLVNSNSDLIRLINNGIKNDLSSRNPTFMNLALHCIANVGSREMAETFASEIPGVLVAGCVQHTQNHEDIRQEAGDGSENMAKTTWKVLVR